MAQITTIIASAGAAERHQSILAAVDSILKQVDVDVEVMVVLNGPSVSSGVVDDLKARSVTLKQLELGSLPHALNYGRNQVTSEYFSFLDDDDIYLPEGLSKRLAILQNRPEIDVVVSNGLIERQDGVKPLLSAKLRLENAPLRRLFESNWLASCGGLFRTTSVDSTYFRVDAKYYEWTMTAFLLGLDRRITYLPDHTFQVNDTAASLSKSLAFIEAGPVILRKMLDYPIASDVRAALKRKLAGALHAASDEHMQKRQLGEAWKYHFKSLSSVHGLKFLPYTSRLIKAALSGKA